MNTGQYLIWIGRLNNVQYFLGMNTGQYSLLLVLCTISADLGVMVSSFKAKVVVLSKRERGVIQEKGFDGV
jgi:hypothetical protein